ncbi:hybrid sensor histidine kinase/response regulator [Paraherbaspirillum soli]|uniref:histidine kinase n=1 Tax=Paraherbaspirillum soli TaxID=631222 RepID=A0ABW0MDG6_9BURK
MSMPVNPGLQQAIRSHKPSQNPPSSMALGRYSRLLLYIGSAILTVLILISVGLALASRIQRAINDQSLVFATQRDYARAEVLRMEARLKQFLDSYEARWLLHKHDLIPLEKYRAQLMTAQAPIITGLDLTQVPYGVMSTLTAPEDVERLEELLKLVRDVPSAARLNNSELGHPLGGYTYDPAGRFIAIVPPWGAQYAPAIDASFRLADFIKRQTSAVEAVLAQYSSAELKQRRVVWIPLNRDPISGMLVAQFGGPVYDGDRRIAVVVASIPFENFSYYFTNPNRDPGFFVLSSDKSHIYDVNQQDDRHSQLGQLVLAQAPHFKVSDDQPHSTRIGATFFLYQRVPGPNWTAVYAFDWDKVLRSIQSELLLTLGLMLLVLFILWGLVIVFDRRVFAPLQRDARQVYESEAFNRTLVATAPVGLCVLDANSGQIVAQNALAMELTSSTADQAQAFYRMLLERHARNGNATPNNSLMELSWESSSPDGGIRHVGVVVSPTRYAGRAVLLCGLTDNSQRVISEQLLRAAKRASDEANQAKSLFLAAMSHEIRTPLHGALGNLELLEREPLAPAHLALARTIRQSFDALLSLINDILDLSKIEAGELTLNNAGFNLVELVESCARTYAPVIAKHGVRFFCLIDPETPVQAIGDSRRLQQILLNLLSNAAKFTRLGQISIGVCPITCASGERIIRFQVIDSGVGISRADQQRLFAPFIQVGDERQSTGGTGLGLSLCKRLTELMGGEISVASEAGAGSVFSCEIPFALEQHWKPDSSAPALRCQILLLCDAGPWRDLLIRQCIAWGATVRTADHRAETIRFEDGRDTILLIAGGDDCDTPPASACGLQHFKQIVVASWSGPMEPEHSEHGIRVTSLSRDGLYKACVLAAGGVLDLPRGPSANAAAQSVAAHEESVLIVDDDAVSRRLLRDYLAALGYARVDQARDGQEALDKCGAHDYDLVLSDQGMARMDGLALAAALREQGSAAPLVLITAGMLTLATPAVRAAGVLAVLNKPVSIVQLERLLKQVFAQPEAILRSARPSAAAKPTELYVKHAELRALFVESWRQDKQVLDQAFKEGEKLAFLRRLHKVKGALSILREGDLAAQCEGIERGCREGGMEDISALRYQTFKNNVERALGIQMQTAAP